MKLIHCLSAVFISFLLLPALAFADCDTDVGSLRWNELSNLMNQAYQDEDYDAALTYSLQLKDMCQTAPTLLYIISDIYMQKNDELNSDEYIRLAHNYMSRYEVPAELEERINVRYDEIIAKSPISEKNLELIDQVDMLQKQLEEERQKGSAVIAYEEQLEFVTKLKWAGTGIAAGGVVLAAVGGGLFYHYYDIIEKADVTRNDWGENGRGEQTGAVLLGVGIAAAVGGSALAIVSFLKEQELEEKTGVALQLNAGINNIGFTMTF